MGEFLQGYAKQSRESRNDREVKFSNFRRLLKDYDGDLSKISVFLNNLRLPPKNLMIQDKNGDR